LHFKHGSSLTLTPNPMSMHIIVVHNKLSYAELEKSTRILTEWN
jgi:hypothetical protein